jgi:hypothetical protein
MLAGIERARMSGLEKTIDAILGPSLAISGGGTILAANLPARELIVPAGGLEQLGIVRAMLRSSLPAAGSLPGRSGYFRLRMNAPASL